MSMGELEARRILLDRVASMRDTLAAQWMAEEVAATLSATSVAALEDAGIFAMKLPAALGGHEADPVTQLLVLEALAEVNPSASWCAMVGASGSGLPAAFMKDDAVAQMYGGPRLPRAAIVLAPMGKVVPDDGGFRLTGRWPFVSGVRHAQWITAGAMAVLTPESKPVHAMLCFPASSATIHDNWQVAGLKGTGSCDISVDDLLVPASFVWDAFHGKPLRGGAIYRIRHPGFVVNEHAGFALGVARRALNAFAERAVNRSRGPSGSLAGRAVVQHMLGEAETRLAAAKALAITLNERAYAMAMAGTMLPDRLQAELRAASLHCTDVAVDVITRSFRFAGGGAVYEGNILQECLRDINVAAQHVIVSDVAYETMGRLALGLPEA